jgi:hypothetical protein
MRNFALLFLVIIIISCNQGNLDKTSKPYTFEELLKNTDNQKLKIRRSTNTTEVEDIANITGEKGIYKFDYNGNLRFYGFLVDAANNYYYGINFDSLGSELDTPKSKVVRWYVEPHKADSLRVSFLLFKVNSLYGKIRVYHNENSTSVPLYKSKFFSNMDVGELILARKELDTIILKGVFKKKASDVEREFVDSVTIPSLK